MPNLDKEKKQFDISVTMNTVYNDDFHSLMNLAGRNDFLGVAALKTLASVEDRLGLTAQSKVLDLCCGNGAPARYLAGSYRCKVTGVDISEHNHRVAVDRTARAGLDDLVNFVHGNAIDGSLTGNGFTHVFDCDGWCYFKDKRDIFSTAYGALEVGGKIVLIEAAHDSPGRYNFEKSVGRCYFESVREYVRLLESCGFGSVTAHDVTEATREDIVDALHGLVVNRQETINRFGPELYYMCVENWADYLVFFTRRGGHQVCITGAKT